MWLVEQCVPLYTVDRGAVGCKLPTSPTTTGDGR